MTGWDNCTSKPWYSGSIKSYTRGGAADMQALPLCFQGGCAMRKADNTRRLCARCRADYRDAGYEPRKIWTKYREPCDICARPAWLYEIAADGDDKR